MVWGRVTDWTDSVCEIGLPLYGLLLRARALGSPQEVVRFLVESGANKDQGRTFDGLTPLSIAAQNGHREVVRFLGGAR